MNDLLNQCRSIELLIIGSILALIGILLAVKFKAREEADISIFGIKIKISGFGIFAFIAGILLIVLFALQKDCSNNQLADSSSKTTDTTTALKDTATALIDSSKKPIHNTKTFKHKVDNNKESPSNEPPLQKDNSVAGNGRLVNGYTGKNYPGIYVNKNNQMNRDSLILSIVSLNPETQFVDFIIEDLTSNERRESNFSNQTGSGKEFRFANRTVILTLDAITKRGSDQEYYADFTVSWKIK